MAPPAVLRPGRVVLFPRQPFDGLLEIAKLGVDQRRSEACPLQLGADVALAVGVGVLALGAGVEPNVREHALAQAPSPADDRRGDAGGDPVEVAAQQRLERHVADCLDVQRVEEQLAELPVAGPRLALAEPFERADVDEHRLAAGELDVVRAGVLGDQGLGEGLAGQPQLQPGGVAQHLERPLVGIREDARAVRDGAQRPTRPVARPGRRLARWRRCRPDRWRRRRTSRRPAPRSRRGRPPSGPATPRRR